MKKKVFVCEDHTIIIDGLRLLLESNPDFMLAGFTTEGSELIPQIDKTRPDILLLDLNLKEQDGFSLLEQLKKTHPEVNVLILTMYEDEELINRAKKLGASGYLPKNIGNEALLLALRGVEKNSFYIPDGLQKKIAQRKAFRDEFIDRMKLTKREVEIIRSIAQGQPTTVIAEKLFVSPYTVETHRKNIFRKLSLSNVAELVRFAHENFLV
jgi:DNA-binding NarL/FixJ family response regulator